MPFIDTDRLVVIRRNYQETFALHRFRILAIEHIVYIQKRTSWAESAAFLVTKGGSGISRQAFFFNKIHPSPPDDIPVIGSFCDFDMSFLGF